MVKATKNLVLIIILVSAIAAGTIIGIVAWYFTSVAIQKNPYETSCLLYQNHSSEKVDLSRENNSEKLLNQLAEDNTILYNQHRFVSNINNDDVALIKRCESNMLYKASSEAINNFNRLVSEPKFNDLTNVEQALSNNNYYKYELTNLSQQADFGDKENFKNNIIKFYTAFYNLYGEEMFKQLLYNIQILKIIDKLEKEKETTVAYTSRLFDRRGFFQCIAFGPYAGKVSIAKREYNTGWWAAPDNIEVLVHETGHALANFAYILKGSRNLINNNFNPQPGVCSDLTSIGGEINVYIDRVDPNDYLINFLGQRAGISNNFFKQQILAAWSFVQSKYGRSGVKDYGGNGELFAEAFAQWFLTPDDKKGLNWEILNEFFTMALKNRYLLW
ncbi:hypothetical protein SSYRP_v1c08740 [Spiroplasma syrphidicola EA-1]|uniref:Uncharacterized protein n=1 Tax=Spiroplasma syrphidicola EA-1 TaxID=1276229 RepID=R4U739_9MOLU|nr:hypothetical protein [Spiroplasma syrphidicola]AGM26463.1 hypothetical protein SSYRP_v1c08740 [Spiroplasma syrphidicola EA-1]